jgi:hypothetical protein
MPYEFCIHENNKEREKCHINTDVASKVLSVVTNYNHILGAGVNEESFVGVLVGDIPTLTPSPHLRPAIATHVVKGGDYFFPLQMHKRIQVLNLAVNARRSTTSLEFLPLSPTLCPGPVFRYQLLSISTFVPRF